MSVTQEVSDCCPQKQQSDQLQMATTNTQNYQGTVTGIREKKVVQPTPPNLREKEFKTPNLCINELLLKRLM